MDYAGFADKKAMTADLNDYPGFADKKEKTNL